MRRTLLYTNYLIPCRLSTDPEMYDLGWLWMAWMFIIRNSIGCRQCLRPKMLSCIFSVSYSLCFCTTGCWYRSEFTASSRSFPATAWLSCLLFFMHMLAVFLHGCFGFLVVVMFSFLGVFCQLKDWLRSSLKWHNVSSRTSTQLS